MAIRFPKPDAVMSPIRSVTNAMNGSTVRTTWSIAWRPLWNSTPTTPPMARPRRAMKPVKPPAAVGGAAALEAAPSPTNGLAAAASSAPSPTDSETVGAASSPPSTGVMLSGRTPDT